MRASLVVFTWFLFGLPVALGQAENRPAFPEKPKAVHQKNSAPVTALAFTEDGVLVAASLWDLCGFDPNSGAMKFEWANVDAPTLALDPRNRKIAMVFRETMSLADLQNGKEKLVMDPFGNFDRSFPFRPAMVALAFSTNGDRLAAAGSVAKVGGRHGLPGGVVTLWDAKSGKETHRFVGLSTGVSSVGLSPDGTLVACGTNGAGGELPDPGEIRIWDIQKQKIIQSIKMAEEADQGQFISVSDVVFSPDGKRLAAAVGSGSRGRPAGLIIEGGAAEIRIWEVDSGKLIKTMTGHHQGVSRILFSRDGKTLASASGDEIRLWHAETGRELQKLTSGLEAIESLAFSPDGKLMAAGGAKGKKGEVWIWSSEQNAFGQKEK